MKKIHSFLIIWVSFFLLIFVLESIVRFIDPLKFDIPVGIVLRISIVGALVTAAFSSIGNNLREKLKPKKFKKIKIIFFVFFGIMLLWFFNLLHTIRTGDGLGMIGVAIVYFWVLLSVILSIFGIIGYLFYKKLIKTKENKKIIYAFYTTSGIIVLIFLIIMLKGNIGYNKELELIEVYKQNLDADGCLGLKNNLLRSKCLVHVAQETLNPELCIKAYIPGTGFMGDCVRYVAVNLKNDTYCEHLGNAAGNCRWLVNQSIAGVKDLKLT